MDPILTLSPVLKSWLLDSQLAPYIDAYADRLKAGGYAATTRRRHLSSLAHFAQWMSESRCTIAELDERVVCRLLDEYRCNYPEPVSPDRCQLNASCALLLAFCANRASLQSRRPRPGRSKQNSAVSMTTCTVCEAWPRGRARIAYVSCGVYWRRISSTSRW